MNKEKLFFSIVGIIWKKLLETPWEYPIMDSPRCCLRDSHLKTIKYYITYVHLYIQYIKFTYINSLKQHPMIIPIYMSFINVLPEKKNKKNLFNKHLLNFNKMAHYWKHLHEHKLDNIPKSVWPSGTRLFNTFPHSYWPIALKRSCT